jgi:hypothetical protein
MFRLLRDLRRGSETEHDVNAGFHFETRAGLLERTRQIGGCGHYDFFSRLGRCHRKGEKQG